MLLLSLFLSATVVLADTASDTRACQNASIQRDSFVSLSVKKQNLDLCLASKKNAQDAATLRSQISTLKDKEATCFQDSRGFLGRMFNTAQTLPTSADVERCDKERTAKETQLTSLQDSLNIQDQQLKVASANYTAQTDATKQIADQKAKTDAVVRYEFDMIKMSIFDSRLQAADAALRLNKMATALDNSAMGLYLRDRMAGLLNSDSMCAAVKTCPKPRNIKGADLNGLFNSKMSTGVNTEGEVTSSSGKASQSVKTNK